MFPLRQILQEMAAEKLRLGLTILAIVWATVSIASMLAIGEGLRQGLIRTTSNGNGNLIMLTGGYATQDYGNFSKGKQLKLKSEDADVLRALPAVEQAEPSATWDASVRNEDNGTWQQPLAVYPQYKDLTGLAVAAGGRWFNPLDMKEQRKVIVIGHSAAVSLFNDSDDFDWDNMPELESSPIGKQVNVGDEKFTVIGVLNANTSNIEDGIPIDYALFVPFTTWQRFNVNASIGAIHIKPVDGLDRETIANTAEQVIARKYGGSMQDEQLLQMQDMLLRQKTMRQFLIGLQSFLGIIGFVTLAVAGIGIANVMYATVKRATRDIGVRMAVGAKPRDIKLHYLIQAFITVFIGGLIGLGLTYGLVQLLRHIPIQGSGFYDYLGKPTPELSLTIVSLVILALSIVGIAAAWFPVRRAASITPLEALQSE
ncbi:ABC transporter permease [Photobacterium lipolyticum]|uniref:Peptide ABC transporter permease n=1 Tax=Photobacterium lipolyticum TaxID=266810 RepID=A0A2T3MWT6_9GAMM|nr:ABC transporter permease [Photobacterium lipolyticum]PSW04402.1 peptide ABC transporter permease [Photobacterium lipolyticum]